MKFKLFIFTLFVLTACFSFSLVNVDHYSSSAKIIFIPSARAANDGLANFIFEQLEETGDKAGINVEKAKNYQTTFYVLGVVIWIFVGFVAFDFFVQLILGALYWILSGGNEEKIKKAKSRIYNAAIGITVSLVAYLLTNFMFKYFSGYLGFELFK